MPYTHHFKAKNSVLLIGFMTFIILMAYFKFLDVQTSLAIGNFAEKQLERQDKRIEELVRENEELRNKLDSSSKINTPDATKQLMRYYIEKYFPEDEWNNAIKISTCESNMNPAVIGPKNKNATIDRGAWQINSVHSERFAKMYGIDWEIGSHDPDLSTKYSKFLYDNNKWNSWVCRFILN